MLHDLFLCCPVFAARIHVSVGLNTDQMEEGEQYSEYSVERNPRAYMSMRDYRSLPWHNQQPLGRNPNTYRSMKDYRNQWMSAPSYMVPLHPQSTSPMEEAILNLTKLVGNFVEVQKAINA